MISLFPIKKPRPPYFLLNVCKHFLISKGTWTRQGTLISLFTLKNTGLHLTIEGIIP